MKKTQTKTKKTSKFKGIAVIALSAIMLIGGCVVGYGAGTRWTYKRGAVQTTTPGDDSEISNSQNPMQLTKGENNGAKFKVRSINADEYQDYEIDAQRVESAYTATVTLANHSEASDKSISLTAEFADGKSAAEYISFSSNTVQSGEQFTFSCLKAFGQPITIKATANGVKSGAKPTCSIKADYVCRYKQVYVSWGACEDDEYLADHLTFSVNGGTDSFVYQGVDFDTAIMVDTAHNSDCMSEGTIVEGIKDFTIVCRQNFEQAENFNTDASIGEPTFDNLLLFKSWQDELILNQGATVLNELKNYAGGNYNTILQNYNSGKTVELNIKFTGKITGIVYDMSCNVKVDPTNLYVSAQNPSFDPDTSGGIIF